MASDTRLNQRVGEKDDLIALLTLKLQQLHLSSSKDEAWSISDAILGECESSASPQEQQKHLMTSLQDYFPSLNGQEVDALVRSLFIQESDGDSESSDQEEFADIPEESLEIDDEEDVLIGEGECELCERYIQLTRHHLIPRSTWPRMETKLMHAMEALKKEDMDRADLILGPGLNHLLPLLLGDQTRSSSTKSRIRTCLQQTCDICRPCHSAVHRTSDNMTLAQEYNTVDKLLEDERIRKYAQWANKQKPGRYAMQS